MQCSEAAKPIVFPEVIHMLFCTASTYWLQSLLGYPIKWNSFTSNACGDLPGNHSHDCVAMLPIRRMLLHRSPVSISLASHSQPCFLSARASIFIFICKGSSAASALERKPHIFRLRCSVQKKGFKSSPASLRYAHCAWIWKWNQLETCFSTRFLCQFFVGLSLSIQWDDPFAQYFASAWIGNVLRTSYARTLGQYIGVIILPNILMDFHLR